MPLDGLYGMGQREGKGVSRISRSLPLRGAALSGVAVWIRLWCWLALGSAVCLSLLSLPCDHLGGDIPLPGRDVSPLASPRLQGCALPSLGNRFSALRRGCVGRVSMLSFRRGCDVWGMEGSVCLLTSLWGTDSVGMGLCFPQGHPGWHCWHHLGWVWGLSSLREQQLIEWRPPNPGWFAEGGFSAARRGL